MSAPRQQAGHDVLEEPGRLARAVLARLAEPGDARMGAAVLRYGPVDVLASLRTGSPALARADGYRTRLDGLDPTEDLRRAQRCRARLLCPGEPEWPSQLDDLGPTAPLALWVRGGEDLRLLAVRSAAVVGARACTAYGEHVAGEMGAELSDRGWCVVSGGAFGIDAAAHRGALSGPGSTIAVLACGVDVPYPRGNDTLFARVLDAGVLVSELPPGAHPTRSRFLERNRVIAAMSRGTVVVEAALRSGALASAARAEALGRQVLGVPGPVTSAASAGVHAWLREGRMGLVTGAADVVEALGSMGRDLAPEPVRGSRPTDELDPESLRVLEALPVRRPAGLDSVARTAGLDHATVLRCLGLLTLDGRAAQEDGGWRLERAAAAPRS